MMEKFKKETFEEFKSRIGYDFDAKGDYILELSILIFYSTIYVHENKLNHRRQLVKIKKLLQAFEDKINENKK